MVRPRETDFPKGRNVEHEMSSTVVRHAKQSFIDPGATDIFRSGVKRGPFGFSNGRGGRREATHVASQSIRNTMRKVCTVTESINSLGEAPALTSDLSADRNFEGDVESHVVSASPYLFCDESIFPGLISSALEPVDARPSSSRAWAQDDGDDEDDEEYDDEEEDWDDEDDEDEDDA